LRSLRIPVEYLAELFTAGDAVPVLRSLDTLSAMRSFMRDQNVGKPLRPEIPARVGMTETAMLELYRLLAIAKYEDRYVIPAAHAEVGKELEDLACSLDDIGGPGQFEHGAPGATIARPRPIAAESFHALRDRDHLRSDATSTLTADLNLPHWDGKGVPMGMPKVRKNDE